MKLANGQNIDYIENGPRVSFSPLLGLFSIMFKFVYCYIQQISNEPLQDHWSSGLDLIRVTYWESLWTKHFLL